MKKNKKNHAITLIFLIIYLLLITFLIYPTFKEIKKEANELIFFKNNIATINAQDQEIEKFRKFYLVNKTNLEKLERSFVDFKNPLPFIEFLEELARQSNIYLKISLPNPPASEHNENKEKGFIIAQIQVKGLFFDVANFIEKLEKGPYLIEIVKLDTNSLEKNLDSKNLTTQGFFPNSIEAFLSAKIFIKS